MAPVARLRTPATVEPQRNATGDSSPTNNVQQLLNDDGDRWPPPPPRQGRGRVRFIKSVPPVDGNNLLI
jgi:hypothetical protein